MESVRCAAMTVMVVSVSEPAAVQCDLDDGHEGAHQSTIGWTDVLGYAEQQS